MFDLASGTVSQTGVGSGSGTIGSTQIRAVGSGWYRCGFVAKTANANPSVEFGLATLATGNSLSSSWGEIAYAGDNASYGYLWGAQVDGFGVGITSYIPTTGSTTTRAQDVMTLP